MYDELVEDLRRMANTWLAEEYKVCAEAVRFQVREAADAIEELQADKAALNGTVTNLLEQIKELGKPRWIPVTERLPDAGERVLCYCRANIYEVMKMRTDGDWVYDTNHVYMHSFVTHWMPLPQAPKEE